MKKLFTLALSAVALMSLSACGEAGLKRDDGKSYFAVGEALTWEASKDTQMKPTTVAAVKKLDEAVGAKLEEKGVKYLYKKDIELKEVEASWAPKAVVNGEAVEFNAGFTLKVILAHYNAEDGTYVNDQWIPNPADTSAAHAEALTDNIFMPHYAKEPDEYGSSWADNPVVLSGAGKYTFVIADYGVASSETVIGYGFALFAK